MGELCQGTPCKHQLATGLHTDQVKMAATEWYWWRVAVRVGDGASEERAQFCECVYDTCATCRRCTTHGYFIVRLHIRAAEAGKAMLKVVGLARRSIRSVHKLTCPFWRHERNTRELAYGHAHAYLQNRVGGRVTVAGLETSLLLLLLFYIVETLCGYLQVSSNANAKKSRCRSPTPVGLPRPTRPLGLQHSPRRHRAVKRTLFLRLVPASPPWYAQGGVIRSRV